MSNPPSQDIAAILAAAGIGTVAATSGWAIFESRLPDGTNVPDTVIAVIDSPAGRDANPKLALDYPAVQILVRGAKDDYRAAHAKAVAIKDELLGKDPITQANTNYRGFHMRGDIGLLDYDESDRPLITMNFELNVEPASAGNRIAI